MAGRGTPRAERPAKDVDCDALIEQHGRGVAAQARKVASRLPRELRGVVDVDDLYAVGLVALWDAAVRHDDRHSLGRPVQLWSFAYRRVVGAMIDAVRRASWIKRSHYHDADSYPQMLRLPMRYAASRDIFEESLPAKAEPLDEGFAHLVRRILTAGLTPRHQHVIEQYFDRHKTMREIADQLGVSETRISQLKSESLAALRACLSADESYYEGA